MRRQSKPRRVFRVMPAWALHVTAPWALGVGVLVSFTAAAGQNSASDWNIAPLTARARAASDQPAIKNASFGEIATGDFSASSRNRAVIRSARLMVGAPEETPPALEESEPHVDLKPEVKNFPQIDRTHKGDPVVAMRPSFETRATTPETLGLNAPAQLSFRIGGKNAGGAETPLAPREIMPADESVDEAEAPVARAPKAEAPSTTQKATAAASPSQNATSATPPSDSAREAMAQSLSERALHGATPQVTRAIALGSSTPAQPDATPIEASSFPRATFALGAPDKSGARPDYAALISPDKLDREKRCLAEAVYFESRSESEVGQAAVAQVVLNRVQSGLYPSNICGVVYQNRHHYKACQFSFACEGRSLRITERVAWATAVRVANEVMEGRTYISDVGRSTHYHTNYVKPRWARALTKMDVIGRHIFYKLKPGQT